MVSLVGVGLGPTWMSICWLLSCCHGARRHDSIGTLRPVTPGRRVCDPAAMDGRRVHARPARARHGGVIAVAALMVVAMVTGVGLIVSSAAAVGKPARASDFVLVFGFFALPAVGCLIVWHRPRSATGRLLVTMGLCGSAYLLSFAWAVFALRTHMGAAPLGPFAAWMASFLIVPAFGLALWIPAVFPSDRITSRWLRCFGRIAIISLAVLTICQALAPEPIDGVDPAIRPIENPVGIDRLAGVFAVCSAVAVVVLVMFGLAALADLVRRFRYSTGEARQQIRWVASSLVLLPLSFVAMAVGYDLGGQHLSDDLLITGQVLFLVGLSAALAIAVLRYRLYELDVVVRRAVSYVLLTLALAIVYVAVVVSIGEVVTGTADGPRAAVAAAVVAIAFAPARLRVQRVVDRLGRRRRVEPYQVISALGRRLDQATDPDEILRVTATTIAETLGFAYVGIELAGEGVASGGVVAAVGRPGPDSRRFPVLHQGALLGHLVVRRHGSVIGDSTGAQGDQVTDDDALLGELARHAGRAVAAARLRTELQTSRAQLVLGREEERRSLRRDLHDGLGPTLAGLALRVDAMSAATTPDDAAAHLAALKFDLGQAIDEIRRIAHSVRPAALDELGFAEAIRQQAHRLSALGGAPQIEVVLPSVIEPMPAAVEVAMLRIAAEAMTNVVRHARARTCQIRISVKDDYRLEVADDGCGIRASQVANNNDGLGLASMRARAEELGGRLEIETPTMQNGGNESAHATGTLVTATIPLAAL